MRSDERTRENGEKENTEDTHALNNGVYKRNRAVLKCPRAVDFFDDSALGVIHCFVSFFRCGDCSRAVRFASFPSTDAYYTIILFYLSRGYARARWDIWG